MAVRVLSWLDHPCVGRERGHQPVDLVDRFEGGETNFPDRVGFWFAERRPDGTRLAVPIDAG